MKKNLLLVKNTWLFFIAHSLLSLTASAQVIALPHAYAHNDYWHKRPLFDALDNGFTHIETDVYLRHSKLMVAHLPLLLRNKHTIEGLYLQPLLARLTSISEHDQTALDTIMLMIDIKSKGEKTYTALRKLLDIYKPILSTCENGKVVIRNLTLVLTGHRPMQLLASEESRFVFADEDLRKINTSREQNQIYSTASCKYSHLIKWRGRGLISAFEKERLKALVYGAHLFGIKVRLWGSPENEVVWHFLQDCGVDLINTDKLVALKQFFTKDADHHDPVNKL